MNLKKMLCGLLMAGIATSLVGCGGSEANEGSTGSSDDQSSGEDIVTLKAHFIGAPPADEQLVEDAINEYTRESIGVELDMVFTDFGDFNQKSQMIINTGESYDIIFTCAWANDYLTNAKKGAYLDLTPYLESDEYKDLYDTIDEAFWDGAKVDGSIYAVPTQKELALMPMYVFNEEYVKAAEFDYQSVTELSDIEPYLEYVKTNYSDATPFLLYADRAFRGTYDYVLGFGCPIAIDNNGQVQYMYDLPEVKQYVLTVRDFFEKGYINLDAATLTGGTDQAKNYGLSFADGQPFAEIGWSQDFKVVTAEMTQPIVTSSTTRGAMLGINQNSENPEAALDFLQALNTDSDLRNLINYGIEGVHYEMISDTQISRTDQGINSYPAITWGFGNLFNTYTLEGEPENKWEVFQEVNDAAFRSQLLGFDVDTSDIKNELAAINNLRIQYEPLIQTGAVDVESTIEEFRTKLEEVGLQKVMDEVQRQVDNFLNK